MGETIGLRICFFSLGMFGWLQVPFAMWLAGDSGNRLVARTRFKGLPEASDDPLRSRCYFQGDETLFASSATPRLRPSRSP